MRPGYGSAYLLQAILVVILAALPYGGFGSVIGVVMGIFILPGAAERFQHSFLQPLLQEVHLGRDALLVMVINVAVAQYQQKVRKKGRGRAARANDPDRCSAAWEGARRSYR